MLKKYLLIDSLIDYLFESKSIVCLMLTKFDSTFDFTFDCNNYTHSLSSQLLLLEKFCLLQDNGVDERSLLLLQFL